MNSYKSLPPGLERRMLYSKILENRKKIAMNRDIGGNLSVVGTTALISFTGVYRRIFFPNARECSICLQKYRGRMKIVELQCKHNFHQTCIDKWIKDNHSCPYCRGIITII